MYHHVQLYIFILNFAMSTKLIHYIHYGTTKIYVTAYPVDHQG